MALLGKPVVAGVCRGAIRPCCLAVVLCSFLSAARGEAAEPPSRPNILFIFTDDHAPHAIGAYGSKINKTPHIDRLAERGAVFENCFCTNSICAPSRAVVLTGVHSHINGVLDNRQRFDTKQPTFTKLLQEAGYETAMIGKWHLKADPVGFDHWEILPGQGDYYNPVFRTPEGTRKYTGYVTDITTNLALRWLEKKRDRDKPFLLMCQHKAPHRSWMPGPRHLNMYDGVDIPEPETLFDDYSGRGSAARRQAMTLARHMFDAYDLKISPPAPGNHADARMWQATYGRLNSQQREDWDTAYGAKNEAYRRANLSGRELVRWRYQRYIKDYLRCIASVDDNIGRMLEYLDEAGLSANTVVVYSSDQGFFLGDHGWYDKRWMYEESLRMPLVVAWPGVIEPGTRIEQLVQNLDFAPTFLTMAGVDLPETMQGRSLVGLLGDEKPARWRTSIYYHYHEFPGPHSVARHYGVRTERYKLIYYYQLGEWELFDLQEDPNEQTSVYDDPASQPLVAELKDELRRLRRQYGDNTGGTF